MDCKGSDEIGRCWVVLRGKKINLINIISGYGVSQDYLNKASEFTSCKQQVRSLNKRGIKIPNPKKVFLQDLTSFIRN